MNIKHKNSKKKPLIILGCILAILIVGVAGYFFLIHQNKSINPTTTKTQNGQKAISDPNVPGRTTKPGDNSGNSQPINKEGGSGASDLSSDIQPVSPTGQFASNHRPNLSGQPTPNAMSSVCTTTPGAHCKLQFQMGGITKELPAQPTDASGSVQWNWTLQDIGLTQGTWTITAVATNGSKSATAVDPIKLEVRP